MNFVLLPGSWGCGRSVSLTVSRESSVGMQHLPPTNVWISKRGNVCFVMCARVCNVSCLQEQILHVHHISWELTYMQWPINGWTLQWTGLSDSILYLVEFSLVTKPPSFILLLHTTNVPNLLFIHTPLSKQSFRTITIMLLLLTEQMEIDQVWRRKSFEQLKLHFLINYEHYTWLWANC